MKQVKQEGRDGVAEEQFINDWIGYKEKYFDIIVIKFKMRRQ